MAKPIVEVDNRAEKMRLQRVVTYLPKRSDLSEHSQAQLNEIALRLNQRPRKTLKFRCPADKLSEFVALTA